MALSAKTNQITGGAATGDAATTDPGFQPKALLIFNGLQTADGAVADAQWNLGVAGSNATERSAGWNSDDNTASSDVCRQFSTTECIHVQTAGTITDNVTATLTSFDVTGFTLNFTTLVTASPKYNYLALGGSDITNVVTGSQAADTTTGPMVVSGLGFQPDVVFLFITLQTAAGDANNNSQYGFGVMDGAGNQWACGGKAQNAQATMNTSRIFSNTKCINIPLTTSNGAFFEASFTSMDSDGFTINIDTTDGTAMLIGYMAIKGGQWKVGTETQKTSTGSKQTTGIGFTPSGVIFGSVCDTQTAGTADHNRQSFGVSTGASNNTAIFAGDSDATANAVASTIMRANKCIVLATEGGATPTVNAEAAISGFGSDDFTLNWSTADATARVFGYVAFGANGGSALTKNLSDTMTVADSIVKTPNLIKTDSMTMADSRSGRPNLIKSDTLTLADSKSTMTGKILTDSFTISDVLRKLCSLSKADTVSLADSLVKILGKNLTDNATLSDVLIKTTGKTLTDLVTASDLLAKTIGLGKSDTQLLSDLLTRVAVLNKADTLTVFDFLSKAAAISPRDTLTLVDALSKTTNKPLSDSFSVSDVLIKMDGKGLSDNVSLGDNIAKTQGKSLSDTVSVSDVLRKNLEKIITDSFSIVDSLVIIGGSLAGRIYETATKIIKHRLSPFSSKTGNFKKKNDEFTSGDDEYKKKLY